MPPVDKDAKISVSDGRPRGTKIVAHIGQCPTPQSLQAELDSLAGFLDLGEREETWEKMEKSVIRFTAVTRGGGYKHVSMYVDGVGRKGVGPQLAACVSFILLREVILIG